MGNQKAQVSFSVATNTLPFKSQLSYNTACRENNIKVLGNLHFRVEWQIKKHLKRKNKIEPKTTISK